MPQSFKKLVIGIERRHDPGDTHWKEKTLRDIAFDIIPRCFDFYWR